MTVGDGRHMRRGGVAVVTALLVLTSCSQKLVISGPGAGRATDLPRRDRMLEYTTRDGENHEFVGFFEAAGDSLRMVKPGEAGGGLRLPHPAETLMVAREDVATVRVWHPHHVATLTGIAIVVTGFVLGWHLLFRGVRS